MTTFYAALDGENEPSLWVRTGPEPDSAQDFYPLLRRCDLAERDHHLWPEIVRRLTVPEIVVDLLQAKATVDAAPAYQACDCALCRLM